MIIVIVEIRAGGIREALQNFGNLEITVPAGLRISTKEVARELIKEIKKNLAPHYFYGTAERSIRARNMPTADGNKISISAVFYLKMLEEGHYIKNDNVPKLKAWKKKHNIIKPIYNANEYPIVEPAIAAINDMVLPTLKRELDRSIKRAGFK